MYKKVIKYTDFNDVEREETFYFNLSKVELTRMSFRHGGAFQDFLQNLIDTKDATRMYEMFEELVQMSYGVKSDDGRRFIKNQEVLDAFVQTDAYSELLIELLNSADAASEFVTGIMPKDISAEVAKQNKEAVKALAE
jgi:hypothetical protein